MEDRLRQANYTKKDWLNAKRAGREYVDRAPTPARSQVISSLSDGILLGRGVDR